jgi:hypothetical protein
MELSTFEIEFPLHVAARERDHWLAWAMAKGVQVEQLGPTKYRLSCVRQRQLEQIGWALFHSNFAKIARVTLVSGAAQSHASVYPSPQLINWDSYAAYRMAGKRTLTIGPLAFRGRVAAAGRDGDWRGQAQGG